MTSIKIYIDRHAYVHVPVDQHWIQIAQTVRDRYAEWNRDFPEDQVSISERDRNSPWNLHWNDMMEPRYYAHECVGEILDKNVPFDFDACNDYQDLEDDLEALLVELEEEVAE